MTVEFNTERLLTSILIPIFNNPECLQMADNACVG